MSAELTKKLAIESGRRIRMARAERNMTLGELSQASGLTSSAIGNYEQGTRRFGDEEARAFSEVFGLPEAYWLALLDRREAEIVQAARKQHLGVTSDDSAISGHHSQLKIQAAIKMLQDIERQTGRGNNGTDGS